MNPKKVCSEPRQSVAVPTAERINQLEEKFDRLIETLESNQGGTNEIFNDYIRKQEVMVLLDKKTTWMWAREKDGTLVPYKIGKGCTFYKVDDVLKLIKNSKQKSEC